MGDTAQHERCAGPRIQLYVMFLQLGIKWHWSTFCSVVTLSGPSEVPPSTHTFFSLADSLGCCRDPAGTALKLFTFHALCHCFKACCCRRPQLQENFSEIIKLLLYRLFSALLTLMVLLLLQLVQITQAALAGRLRHPVRNISLEKTLLSIHLWSSSPHPPLSVSFLLGKKEREGEGKALKA